MFRRHGQHSADAQKPLNILGQRLDPDICAWKQQQFFFRTAP
jgi:hypothetical protein